MIELSDGSYPIKRSRLVGWYSEKSIAEKMVIRNDLDINDGGYYSFAVVEKVPEGTYALPPLPEYETWYKWDKASHCYKTTPKPGVLKQIISFGIG